MEIATHHAIARNGEIQYFDKATSCFWTGDAWMLVDSSMALTMTPIDQEPQPYKVMQTHVPQSETVGIYRKKRYAGD